MTSKLKEEDSDNVYAHDVQGNVVFIKNIERGRKGYFCMGCHREMQAVHSNINNRKWFFRHDVKAMKGRPRCTYSDETYRHKLAKLILLNIKKIKVPAVYKYPPKGIEGSAIEILRADFVEAFFVEQELSFFENDLGDIEYTKNFNKDQARLLVRPDITFFDMDKNPVLLIELIATHKLSQEKKLKLKRLGLNTVQVAIPKDSQEAIKNVFFNTEHTKWIYNYEQENTEYVPITGSYPEGIPSIDEVQREFFEESFKCRAAQIRNLLFAIEGCMGTKQYRTIEQEIIREISRVEENTERERNEFGEFHERREKELTHFINEEERRIEDAIERAREGLGEFHERRERELKEEFRAEQEDIGTTADRIRQEEDEFQDDKEDLERRYITKREDLENKIRAIENLFNRQE